jgi:hypothetical protein
LDERYSRPAHRVIPAQAGIHVRMSTATHRKMLSLDSGLRRNDLVHGKAAENQTPVDL